MIRSTCTIPPVYAPVNGFTAQTEAFFDSPETFSINIKANLYKRFQDDCKPLFLLIPETPGIRPPGGVEKTLYKDDGVV